VPRLPGLGAQTISISAGELCSERQGALSPNQRALAVLWGGGGGGGGRVHGQKATTRLGMQKPRITAIYEFLARSAAAILKGSILRETS
jgi:hypothetical protein